MTILSMHGRSLFAVGFSLALAGWVMAQDAEKNKKGTKKPADAASKNSDEKKAEKSVADLDPKQQKWAEKKRLEIEKKFRKSKKETIYVFSLHEKRVERIEPDEPEELPDTKPAKGKRRPALEKKPQYDEYIHSEIFKMEDREAAIEKVHEFLAEFPPSFEKKKSKKTDTNEPPPPKRDWEFHAAIPKTKEGEIQAEGMMEKIGDKYTRAKQLRERIKMEKAKSKLEKGK